MLQRPFYRIMHEFLNLEGNSDSIDMLNRSSNV